MMHNDPTSGHFATKAMFQKIKERYYWPQYYEDIKQLLNGAYKLITTDGQLIATPINGNLLKSYTIRVDFLHSKSKIDARSRNRFEK